MKSLIFIHPEKLPSSRRKPGSSVLSQKSLYICHSRGGGNPSCKPAFKFMFKAWIPAFAGMTAPKYVKKRKGHYTRSSAFFNRIFRAWIPAFAWMTIVLLSSCNKKDRLTASNFSFIVSPSALTVVKGDSATFQAKATSGSGSLETDPTWTLSGTTSNDLNTQIGSTVILTPSTLGDVVLTATFDGVLATAQVAVVTYIPSSSDFSVYNDDGLPTGNVDSDIFVFPASGLDLQELSSGYTPDGIKYQRASNFTSGQAWGVTLDSLGAGKSKDLSSFSSGNLKFSIRLVNRSVGVSETININIEDIAGPADKEALGSTFGFNRLSLRWQEISIPLSLYGSINLTLVKVPFAVEILSVSSALSFDIDAVRWE